MNAAVVKLAEPKGGRGQRTPAEPLALLGAHPETGVEVKVLNGRFGPYITDGSVNANVPKGTDPKAVTLEQAVELLAERAARAPAKGRKKPAAKKAATKKTPAKKAATGKAPAKKPASGKKASA